MIIHAVSKKRNSILKQIVKLSKKIPSTCIFILESIINWFREKNFQKIKNGWRYVLPAVTFFLIGNIFQSWDRFSWKSIYKF